MQLRKQITCHLCILLMFNNFYRELAVVCCRRSHAVLRTTLPTKEEHVFLIRMSPIQRSLYTKFMTALKASGIGCWASSNNPIKAFSVCCKVRTAFFLYSRTLTLQTVDVWFSPICMLELLHEWCWCHTAVLDSCWRHFNLVGVTKVQCESPVTAV